ncbi:MAG: isoaspartyl peptidase/L-asparaginase [Vulcanisaeta sp.]|jgi:beta-aspartyl-peptidase (threonine type)|uniref:Plant-type L-asparaginase n=1 Tax=Vulcanisaeta moutnovskia (strain 768-28) TaxID=985053 RepID=F0QSZ4_VULM7|nr:isoaspartyl peptidase/L-asparaginase [Vulcanisaeta moutnovskia]ADY00415.1 peptidase T2 asparaginase 2 [Vulcanisaeta moutnovskia 768-28]
MNFKATIAVHGGAGSAGYFVNEEHRRRYLNGLVNAVSAGLEAVKRGNALDMVVEAVTVMEFDGSYDAGKGSVLNLYGEVEQDAGVMWGKDLSVGAVASVKHVINTIRLARLVMERTDHVLIMGDGAEELAKQFNLWVPSTELINEFKINRYNSLIKNLRSRYEKNVELARKLGLLGTVGAVALDRDGNLAAATSTGGTILKWPGRVGDSPLPGAGYWAENGVCAVSVTGIGEFIIRAMASFRVSTLIKSGVSIGDAVRQVVDYVTKLFGSDNIGLIAIDSSGNVASAFNTEVMGRAWGREGMNKVTVAHYPNDPFP